MITSVSQEGLDLIKKFEGFRENAYTDEGGIWTVGYGFIFLNGKRVVEGDKISVDEASQLLKKTADELAAQVSVLVPTTCTQRQIDSLTSFSYNLGIKTFKKSNLNKKINIDPYHKDVEKEFLRYNKVNGKISVAITKRRRLEAHLYLNQHIALETIKDVYGAQFTSGKRVNISVKEPEDLIDIPVNPYQYENIGELISGDKSLTNYTPKSLLYQKDKNGKTNADKIVESAPSTKEKKSIEEKLLKKDYAGIPLKNVSTLTVSKKNLSIDLLETVRIPKFEELTRKEEEQRIDAVVKSTWSKGNERFSNLKIWLYSNVVSQLIDITPYVESASTNHSVQGGGFSISLEAVAEEMFQKIEYPGLRVGFDLGDDDTINRSWFEKIITHNSPIFISLEDESDLACEIRNIYGVRWTMFGLVKNVSQSFGGVSISGNDYRTLLGDDGVYYFPSQYKHDTREEIFSNLNGSFIRLAGIIYSYYSYGFQTIKTLMNFVLDNLTNIRIADDYLFSSWPASEKNKISVVDKAGSGNTQSREIVAPGVWQVIDTVVAKNLEDRTMFNSTFSVDQGPISSFVDKICQRPFAELVSDTFINRYVFHVRRPPFDRKGYLDGIENCIVVPKGSIFGIPVFKNCQEVYSMYKLNPAFFPSPDNQFQSAFTFPGIFFSSYEQKYGTRPLEISDQYFPLIINNDPTKTSLSLLDYVDRYYYDLAYIIESNAYLPFSRQCFIDIEFNPYIKSSNFIYLEATNEYYYVDSVEHKVSGSGSGEMTSLSLSRGLVKDFVYGVRASDLGVEVKYKRVLPKSVDNAKNRVGGPTTKFDTTVNYFNIINTDFSDELAKSKKENSSYTGIGGAFKENVEVFKFFASNQHLKNA